MKTIKYPYGTKSTSYRKFLSPGILGTFSAHNKKGEERYFDYDRKGANKFAGYEDWMHVVRCLADSCLYIVCDADGNPKRPEAPEILFKEIRRKDVRYEVKFKNRSFTFIASDRSFKNRNGKRIKLFYLLRETKNGKTKFFDSYYSLKKLEEAIQFERHSIDFVY